MVTARWPDEALLDRAATIGPALQQLIDNEPRWLHRRVERIELTSATQLTRMVAADLTVPLSLADALSFDAPAAGQQPTRFVVPLGVLPKEPLRDFTLKPDAVHRLTADQANPLVIAALAPLAAQTGEPLEKVLRLLRSIVRSEQPGGQAGSVEYRRLVGLFAGRNDDSAVARLLDRARQLDTSYVLLGVLTATAGAPTRITYAHRQAMRGATGGVDDPPLEIDVELPHASGPGPPYRVELVAPDGLDIERASLVARGVPGAIVPGDPHDGRFVQLRAPDAQQRPDAVALQAAFAFPPGGIAALATIAGFVSTAALGLAVLASYGIGLAMKGGTASAFLAAPALVTGLVLGFATTPVTSRPVNRLRAAAFSIALLGVLGGLTVSLLSENKDYLNLRHGLLIGLAITSLLVWGGYPLRVWLRTHDRPKAPPDVPQ